MAEPARKLEPNDNKGQYLRKIGEDIKESQVDTTPDLQYLDSENGPVAEGEEYTPPDLQYLGDEDEQEEEQEQEEQLSPDDLKKALEKKKKVPEYSQKPPGKYQPGGPAIKAKGQPAAATKPGVGQTATSEAGAAAKKGAQAAADAAAQAVKKAAAQAAKWAAEMGAKAIAATAEYWFPILMIIIAAIIIIFAVIMLIKALQTPNSNGTSPVQAADIINDHPLIQTVLSLSSAADFQKMLDQNKSKLLSDIESFKTEISAKAPGDPRIAPTVAKLDEVVTLLSAYTAPDAAKSAAIRQKLLEAIKPWSVALNPNGLIFPARGHNAGQISLDYGAHGTHRGIDIGLDVGTIYRAPASGKIVYLVDNIKNWPTGTKHYGDQSQNGGFGNAIIVQIEGSANATLNGRAWEIHHLDPNSVPSTLKVGSIVSQGMIIARSGHNGSSSGPHIHFQLDKEVCGGSSDPRPCGASDGLGTTLNPKPFIQW